MFCLLKKGKVKENKSNRENFLFFAQFRNSRIFCFLKSKQICILLNNIQNWYKNVKKEEYLINFVCFPLIEKQRTMRKALYPFLHCSFALFLIISFLFHASIAKMSAKEKGYKAFWKLFRSLCFVTLLITGILILFFKRIQIVLIIRDTKFFTLLSTLLFW